MPLSIPEYLFRSPTYSHQPFLIIKRVYSSNPSPPSSHTSLSQNLLDILIPLLFRRSPVRLKTALLRASIPALLQLHRTRLLKPLPDLDMLLQLLKDIHVGWEIRGAQPRNAELEDGNTEDDEDECEPPQ